jgi:SAM-dependent methyltransferase
VPPKLNTEQPKTITLDADAERIPPVCAVCGTLLQTHFPSVLDPQTGEKFSILNCPACGHGITSPQPRDVAPYYTEAYYGGRHGFTASYCAGRRLRWVHSLFGAARDRKLLDVGCGDGSFLLAAQESGWHAVGTERNAEPARKSGLEVFPDVGTAAALGPYDCITLWHVLEHMPDPRATLRDCRNSLNPEGLLFVAVPDAAGLQARVFGARWIHLDVPRHLHHFTAGSLVKLLQETGFAPARTWHQEFEYDLLGWSQSALNSLGFSPMLLFRALTGRAEGAGKISLIANWICGAGFSALSLPLVPLGSLLRRGGTLVVAAQFRTPGAPR